MTDTDGPLTAKMKLAQSRAELLAAMGYREVLEGQVEERIEPLEPGAAAIASSRSKPMRFALPLLSKWWQGHPARNVVDLTLPLLEHYGQTHPGRLVAYGAGTGALLVILKPWRLLSAVTIAGLLFKTLASLGTTALKAPRS